MNSRKKLLRYLEKNNGFNVNRDIYEKYKKGYINKIKVKEEDIKSINHFIHDYLAFIYESLQNDERNGLQSSIREVINFLETTSSKKIYKEKLSDLHKLLSVLLYYITISLRSNSKKSNETILCYSKSHDLFRSLSDLSDTINCFFIMFPKENIQIHKQNHLSKLLNRIYKKLQEYDNSKVLQETLFKNLSACLTNPYAVESSEFLSYNLYNVDINKGYQTSAESEYLKQLLILLTENYWTTFNSSALLLNITGYEYIRQFINSIISELKQNKDTEVTYNYFKSIRDFCLKTKFHCERNILLKDDNRNRLSNSNLRKQQLIKKRKISLEKWYNQPDFSFYDDDGYSDMWEKLFIIYYHHPIYKHSDIKVYPYELSKKEREEFFAKDKKELFLTLVVNYESLFSNNTRLILKSIQKCPFWKVYDLISLIPSFKERESIRETIESIIRYLENNNCVDVDTLWIANISLEDLRKTKTIRQSIQVCRTKPSCNLVITLGFSDEVEHLEHNDLLEGSELEPFYVPIDYREKMFEDELEFNEVENHSDSILSI